MKIKRQKPRREERPRMSENTLSSVSLTLELHFLSDNRLFTVYFPGGAHNDPVASFFLGNEHGIVGKIYKVVIIFYLLPGAGRRCRY